MGIVICKSEGLDKENEINHWLDAYDKVFTYHQINIDGYFKRTQILMFAIQAGLVAVFIKLLSTEKPNNGAILSVCGLYWVLLAISGLGVFSCFIWLIMIRRYWITLEHCRCHMRYIERHLMNLGVPIALFRSEAAVSYRNYWVIFADDNDKKCKKNCKDTPCQDKYKCQKRYPYKKEKAKIGLMNLEKLMLYVIRLAWAICFSIFLYRILEKFFYSLILPILVLIYTIYEWYKYDRNKKDRNKKDKNKQSFLFWELKEDFEDNVEE